MRPGLGWIEGQQIKLYRSVYEQGVKTNKELGDAIGQRSSIQ